jgi:formate hydrogenlyase subunit 3/multisubunit Na+/H+ antiporter MnhD subunit
MAPAGKTLIVLGLAIVVIGVLLWGGTSIPIVGPIIGRIGRLPGDIYIRRGNFSFYFPITTAIVVSIVLSLVLALMRR